VKKREVLAGLSEAQILDSIKHSRRKGAALGTGCITDRTSSRDILQMTRAAAREPDELEVNAD
jgi:hypothetical protein